MKLTNKQFIERWKTRRVKGKWKYVIRYTLFLALTIFIAFAFLASIIDQGIAGTLTLDSLLEQSYAGYLISSLIGAYLVALFSWNENEKKYNKLVNHKQNVKDSKKK
jgi:hypothetical protein